VRTKVDREAARISILEGAEGVMRRYGIGAFTYSELARELGMKPSNLYYYFPSRDSLFLELIKHQQEKRVRALRQIDRQGESCSHKLQLFIHSYLSPLSKGEVSLDHAIVADLIGFSETTRATLLEYFENTIDWIEGVIRQGHGAVPQEFHCVNPREKAKGFFSALVGAQSLCAAIQDGTESCMDIMCKYINSLKIG